MRIASWPLTLLLGAVWMIFSPLVKPASGSHVVTRFLQKAQVETGISRSFLAVLEDYRSLDLLLLCLLFFGVFLACLLPSLLQVPVAPMKWKARLGVLMILAGLGCGLWVGFYCLRHGSNFLDFEALAGMVPPGSARQEGGKILGAALLLSLLGALLVFGSKETPLEDSHGH